MKKAQFRVWNKKEKRWATPFEVAISLEGWITSNNKSLEKGPEYFELSPFTSVLDSKGKGVYEGDILQLKNGAYWTVDFSNGSYVAFGNPLSAYVDSLGKLNVNLQIVGNKYENPEIPSMGQD